MDGSNSLTASSGQLENMLRYTKRATNKPSDSENPKVYHVLFSGPTYVKQDAFRFLPYLSSSHSARSFGKFGVPKPVTGSKPFAAANPDVPHPGFVPVVMSLKAPLNPGE
jgi:hypothetical protein